MVPNKKTKILSGTPVSPGLTFGEARVVSSLEQTIVKRPLEPSQVASEIARLNKAVEESLGELIKLKESAGKKIGGPVSKIFDSQLLMASDPEFLKSVRAEIESSLLCAEFVYHHLVEQSMEPLKRSNEPYLRQMAQDIEAVSSRILRRLTGQSVRHIVQNAQDYIFVAKLFSAADILVLYERKVKAIVISGGGANSHMSLIARSLLIPTIIGVEEAHLKIKTGDRLIIDGEKGEVKIHPSQKDWNELRKKKAKISAIHILKLNKISQIPPQTADEHPIEVAANIDIPGPIDQVLGRHNIGVGLFRTEFLYLQGGRFPSEEQQYEIYQKMVKRYSPQPLTIRTFDLGSDKYFKDDNSFKENNPALGWRGIRASFDMPIIFRDQIRAILRASAYGEIKILLPMIADITEFLRALRSIKRVMADLRKRLIRFDQKIKIGVMIEVPSAAVGSMALAEKADFFSIGSNDLTQYTLAADRDNPKLEHVFNPLHPSVIQLMSMTIEAARQKDKPVAVCGEIASDILAAPLLIGMGVSQLSMNPSKIYRICKLISKLRIQDTYDLAEKVLKLKSTKEVEHLLLDFNNML
ncbi:MAG: phosphoenolpyruvate--protein phosphotransferase [Candidatus Zixiibacteriota bacterium]